MTARAVYTSPSGAAARAAALGVGAWFTSTDGTAEVQVWSDSGMTVLDDSHGQLTAAQVAQAVSDASAADAALAHGRSQASQALVSLAGQRSAFQQDLSSDISAITQSGWDGLTAQQRTDIVTRILQVGLASTMQAHMNHLVVSGVIPPQQQ